MARAADYRTEQVGLRLTHHLAPGVYEYRKGLRREQSVCDGWATRGETAGRGSSENTLPEAAVLMVGHLEQVEAKLNAAILACETAADALARLVLGGFGEHVPAAAEELRCRDAQHGLDAPLWSDDVECRSLPDKRGLCQRHYSAWRRYLQSRNVDTSHHYEPS